MSRLAFSFAVVVVACTGGAGPIGQTGGTSSSGSGTGSSSGSGTGTGGGTITASEFSQDCVEDSDCSPVFEGSICSQCGCPNAAIAKSDLSEYTSKRQAAGCPQTDVECSPCEDSAAVCAQGTCSLTKGAATVPDGG